MLRVCSLIVCWLAAAAVSNAQVLPPCSFRPQVVIQVRTQLGVCTERILELPYVYGRVLSSIAAQPDGTLYLAEPSAGVVWIGEDTDGDSVSDTLRPLLTGLERPASLLWHEGNLYIAGGQRLYRYDGQILSVVLDDLPVVDGQVARLLIVHEDRLWVSVGGCIGCDAEDRVLSVPLDGAAPEVLLMGYYPLAAAWSESLYVAISGEEDALLAWSTGAPLRPVLRFAGGAAPISLLPYKGGAFAQFAGQMLLLLGGDELSLEPVGFALVALAKLGEEAVEVTAVAPGDVRIGPVRVPSGGQYGDFLVATFNRNGEGLAPQRLSGMAVDDQGRIYLLQARGAVLLLRP